MVSSVLDQARRYLGLLDLARLHTAFASLQSVKQAHAGMQATLAVKCDAGMQVREGACCYYDHTSCLHAVDA
jgi:hypothetical protein